MKIGDEVHVHGYVDEIRKDVVIIRNKGGYFGTVPEEVLLTDIKYLTDQEFLNKAYKMPNGREAIFHYDRNGVGKITLESVDMLMGELIAYQQCIQSRSFWDSKHCDGCRFYDNCPFNPQEDEDEPQSEDERIKDVVQGFMGIVDSMRNPTEEEKESVNNYLESISKPTGVNIFDMMDELQTERIK